MPITPNKQPVAADPDWLDVYYIKGHLATGNISIGTKAVKPYPDNSDRTVLEIICAGIWNEDMTDFIPPSAIIRIRKRASTTDQYARSTRSHCHRDPSIIGACAWPEFCSCECPACECPACGSRLECACGEEKDRA